MSVVFPHFAGKGANQLFAEGGERVCHAPSPSSPRDGAIRKNAQFLKKEKCGFSGGDLDKTVLMLF